MQYLGHLLVAQSCSRKQSLLGACAEQLFLLKWMSKYLCGIRSLKDFKEKDMQLLARKLIALFDVRLQQWRASDYLAQVSEDGAFVPKKEL
jgi:hypothetical protein